MSKIEWTEQTWNPVVGCTEVSPGCANCYAKEMAWRMQHMGLKQVAFDYANTVKKLDNGKKVWTDNINLVPYRLKEPLENKKPTVYFVCSMSDLFHKGVPFDYIDRIFTTMAIAHWHTFQVLTKRPERMLEWFSFKHPDWANAGMQGDERIRYQTYQTHGMQISADKWHWPLKNVWIGTSVENQKAADQRIPLLLQVPASIRFLSCEPLLGPLDLDKWLSPCGYYCSHSDADFNAFMESEDFQAMDEHDQSMACSFFHADNHRPDSSKLDWIICGGESGHNARPMHPDWARSLRDQCQKSRTPFFFKQWGQWKPIDMPSMQENIVPLTCNERWLNYDSGHGFHGHQVYRMRKMPKHDAGRLLDGKEFNELPKPNHYESKARAAASI